MSTQLLFLFRFPESPQFHFSKFWKCNAAFASQLSAYKGMFSCGRGNAVYRHYILPSWLANERLGWQAESRRWGSQTGSLLWVQEIQAGLWGSTARGGGCLGSMLSVWVLTILPGTAGRRMIFYIAHGGRYQSMIWTAWTDEADVGYKFW